MIKEAWDSFKDNLRERVSNPFLGTFALVWVVHNWKIVYAFFYFDKEWKLQQKIGYFKNYWMTNGFVSNLVWVALITILVLMGTYVFLTLSRFMANYFENIIIPYIHKYTKGRTVLAEIHDAALNQIISLKEKVENERRLKDMAVEEIEQLIIKLNNRSEILRDEGQDVKEIHLLAQTAKAQFEKSKIESILLRISKQEGLERQNEIVEFLKKNDLIEYLRKEDEKVASGGTSAVYIYTFTENGHKFKRQFFV